MRKTTSRTGGTKTGWHTCTAANADGEFCDAPARADSPISLCEQHLMRAFGYCQDLMLAASDEILRSVRTTPTALEFSEPVRNRIREARSVVYYAMIGGHIKIGTTVSLGNRMNQLADNQLAANLIVTEPGDRELEAERHRQFNHLLAKGREYFLPGADLLAHIVRLQSA